MASNPESQFPRLSRRSFFKALISLGVVASFPEARALERRPVLDASVHVQRDTRYFAIWQLPGQKARLTMFTGVVPVDAEVIIFRDMKILRFARYPDGLRYHGSVSGTWTKSR